MGGGGLLNQGNQRRRDRADKSTKEQFVLLNPREKFGFGVSWSTERVMANGQG